MDQTGEQQYLTLCRRIIDNGIDIKNERTRKVCKTVINADFEYNASENKFPLITTRKAYWKQAIAEMLGYLRGYNNAQQFADIGCNTWFANANENEQWLKNPYRAYENDLGAGFAYAQGRNWFENGHDQYQEIIQKLSQGIDDRRLIMTFNNPGSVHASALPACMHTHHFSLLDGKLYLTSYQRSIDVPLGLVFNMIQTVWLLRITAQITGHEAGSVYHKMVNCHLYEDQINLMQNVQLTRTPFSEPSLIISPKIKTLNDLETWVTMDDFDVFNYKHHDPIKYPFSV